MEICMKTKDYFAVNHDAKLFTTTAELDIEINDGQIIRTQRGLTPFATVTIKMIDRVFARYNAHGNTYICWRFV